MLNKIFIKYSSVLLAALALFPLAGCSPTSENQEAEQGAVSPRSKAEQTFLLAQEFAAGSKSIQDLEKSFAALNSKEKAELARQTSGEMSFVSLVAEKAPLDKAEHLLKDLMGALEPAQAVLQALAAESAIELRPESQAREELKSKILAFRLFHAPQGVNDIHEAGTSFDAAPPEVPNPPNPDRPVEVPSTPEPAPLVNPLTPDPAPSVNTLIPDPTPSVNPLTPDPVPLVNPLAPERPHIAPLPTPRPIPVTPVTPTKPPTPTKSLRPAEVMARKINDFKENSLDFSKIFSDEGKEQKNYDFLLLFALRAKSAARLEKDYTQLKNVNDFLKDPNACGSKWVNRLLFRTLEESQKEEIKNILELVDGIVNEFAKLLAKYPGPDLVMDILTAYFIGSNDPRIFEELARLAEFAENGTAMRHLGNGTKADAYAELVLYTVWQILKANFGS